MKDLKKKIDRKVPLLQVEAIDRSLHVIGPLFWNPSFNERTSIVPENFTRLLKKDAVYCGSLILYQLNNVS